MNTRDELADALRVLLQQTPDYKDGEGAAKFHALNIGRRVLAAYDAERAREAWTPADSAAALAEGWEMFESGHGLEIQRIDCPEDDTPPKFDGDAFAIAQVYWLANEGSELHRKALRICAAHNGWGL